MRIKIIIITILFVGWLSSCKKNDANSNMINNDNRNIADIIMSYKAFSNKQVSGDFFIQSLTFNNQPSSNKQSTQIGGGFYDKSGNVEKGGILSIGPYNLPSINSSYSLDNLSRDSLFGKKITFKLLAPYHNNSSINGVSTTNSISADGTQFDTILTTIYVPAAIYVDNSNLNADPSNVITWNADPNNTNGVVIVAEYSPGLTLNSDISTSYPVPIRNSISVPDNGSATLSTDFYAQFPAGSSVTLYVGRGNYAIASSNGYDYKIGAYTSNAIYVIKIPVPTLINGSNVVNFTSTTTNGSGTITAPAGRTVTVTAVVGGGNCTEVFNISGASFTSNTSSPGTTTLVANTNQPNASTMTATFVMPASGSVNWTGNCYTSGSGDGNIYVQ